MAVPEQRVEKKKNESGKAVKKDSFLNKTSSGFIPPSKQAKMKRDSECSGRGRSPSGPQSASGSQRPPTTRSLSSGANSKSKKSTLACSHCHDRHPHDARGRCLPMPEDGLTAARKRLIGIKPPKCNNSGDGIFIKRSRKKNPLLRSKTR